MLQFCAANVMFLRKYEQQGIMDRNVDQALYLPRWSSQLRILKDFIFLAKYRKTLRLLISKCYLGNMLTDHQRLASVTACTCNYHTHFQQ